VIATPAGLLLASAFAAAPRSSSVATEPPRSFDDGLRPSALALLLIAWAVACSPVDLLDDPEEEARSPSVSPPSARPVRVRGLAVPADHRTGGEPSLSVAVAFVLLAGPDRRRSPGWHASWWEWHVLIAVAFGS
jgi:hypothetical protein